MQVIVEVGIAFCVTNSPVTEHHSRETLKWSTEKPYCHYVPLLFYVVSTSGLSLHDSTMREVVNNLTIFHLISIQNQTDLHKFVVDWPVSLFCDRSDWLLLTYPPPSLQGKSVEACQSDWLPEQIDRSVYIYLLSLVTCSYNLLVQRNQLLQLGISRVKALNRMSERLWNGSSISQTVDWCDAMSTQSVTSFSLLIYNELMLQVYLSPWCISCDENRSF